ncbi:hypothetical protein B9Z55_002570 [Caenorhabditis nigoni]|uniref:Uncharacterized protein n=1 Tax=Caenorhabditis nigoni TaxID=1611254 RepID=A0A2G5VLC3_9PELO|nr:hypothetical protein B9Z55_002570 [Caenorhabditis nigoni]
MERKSVLSLQRSSLGTSWLRAKTNPTSSDDSTSRTPRLFDLKCQGIWIERPSSTTPLTAQSVSANNDCTIFKRKFLISEITFFRSFFCKELQLLPRTSLQGFEGFCDFKRDERHSSTTPRAQSVSGSSDDEDRTKSKRNTLISEM